MPDPAKFEKLREIGYRIPVTCGTCDDGQFATAQALWGTCGRHLYQHGKHTGPARGVSVYRHGFCPFASVKTPSPAGEYGAHGEFFKKVP